MENSQFTGIQVKKNIIVNIYNNKNILIAYHLLNTGKGSKYFLFTLYNNWQKTGFSPFHRRSYSSDRGCPSRWRRTRTGTHLTTKLKAPHFRCTMVFHMLCGPQAQVGLESSLTFLCWGKATSPHPQLQRPGAQKKVRSQHDQMICKCLSLSISIATIRGLTTIIGTSTSLIFLEHFNK